MKELHLIGQQHKVVHLIGQMRKGLCLIHSILQAAIGDVLAHLRSPFIALYVFYTG